MLTSIVRKKGKSEMEGERERERKRRDEGILCNDFKTNYIGYGEHVYYIHMHLKNSGLVQKCS